MPKTKAVEHGGGAAAGLSGDFINFLDSFIKGTPGGAQANPMAQTAEANPLGNTNDISSNIRSLLGGNTNFGDMGASLTSLIQKQQGEDVANLRERYTASGAGSSVGSPAAGAEALYRSQAAPQAAMAMGNLSLQTLMPLLQMISGTANKGISQKTSDLVVSPDVMTQLAQGLSGLAQGGGAFLQGMNAGKLAFV